MQDLKNLSRKKPSRGFSIFGSGSNNRRFKPAAEPLRFRLAIPVGKRRQQIKLALLFLAVVLALAPVCASLLRKAPPIWPQITSWINFHAEAPPKTVEAAIPPTVPSHFETAGNLLGKAENVDGQLSAVAPDGIRYNYTLLGGLQKRVHDYLALHQVPYAVFVAIEPSTGRILGMTSYSSVDPNWGREAFYGLYPMASLFKIITASAALESRKITPGTVIEFRGNSYSENPRYWYASPKGRNNRMDVTHAMGKSINPVYGRLASDIAGRNSIMASVDRFGFNQNIFPGIPVKSSQAAAPASDHNLMLMGAGLDHDVKISPLHAAVIMSAIANNGKMMAPALTRNSVTAGGIEENLFVPKELRQLVAPETAASLKQMLSSTVLTGTSRKAFHDRRGRPLLRVPIAAKTGSINGTDPKGHYSWFAAFAPIDNPRIALAALVINPDKWKIKASQVGEQALEEFFRKQGRD
ncbi:MAG: penicillin-binding protein [Deltaproteobacteria bacterium]|nr:penicillin-binding protein [Deltaproteobacteria bacterium]